MRLKKRGGVYHYDFSYHGQRVRGTTGETDKYLAGLKAHDDFEKVRANGSADYLLRKAPTLEEFSAEFLQWVDETQSLGKHGKRVYTGGWQLLKVTRLAGMAMDKITNDDCERLIFPGGPSNANKALRTLRRMFKKAKELKRFYGDRPTITERDEDPRSIEMTEANALLIDMHWQTAKLLGKVPVNFRKRVQAIWESQDSRDAFRLIRSTGMRPNETFKMRWEFVNWQQAQYQNPKGKSKAARRNVPLNFPPFNCVEILRARHERMGCPGDGWIFPSPTAKEGHMTTIQKPFTRARKLAGLPKQMVLYTARHGAATSIAEVTTLKNSMELLGHSDVKTAMRYQHPDSKDIAERLWAKTNGSVQ